MKNYHAMLGALLLIFGFVGSAGALPFIDTVNFENVLLAEGPVADLFLDSKYTYQHNMPDDFEVPWDIVNSATLTIEGYWIDDNNDKVKVSGTKVGYLEEGGSYFAFFGHTIWDNPSVSNFDISSAFDAWSTGDPLKVRIIAEGDCGDGILELSKSVFYLDYENAADPGPMPVPEPATSIFLGLGLLGMVACRGKKIG